MLPSTLRIQLNIWKEWQGPATWCFCQSLQGKYEILKIKEWNRFDCKTLDNVKCKHCNESENELKECMTYNKADGYVKYADNVKKSEKDFIPLRYEQRITSTGTHLTNNGGQATKSLLYYPISDGKEVYGVLSFQSTDPDYFTDAHESIMKAMCAMFAATMEKDNKIIKEIDNLKKRSFRYDLILVSSYLIASAGVYSVLDMLSSPVKNFISEGQIRWINLAFIIGCFIIGYLIFKYEKLHTMWNDFVIKDKLFFTAKKRKNDKKQKMNDNPILFKDKGDMLIYLLLYVSNLNAKISKEELKHIITIDDQESFIRIKTLFEKDNDYQALCRVNDFKNKLLSMGETVESLGKSIETLFRLDDRLSPVKEYCLNQIKNCYNNNNIEQNKSKN